MMGDTPAKTAEPKPLVSFLLATHNRREVVRNTLTQVTFCGLAKSDYEIIAVDNASTDGTPDAIAGDVHTLIRLDHNAGSCAKYHGLAHARGRYVVMLDDDSHPRPGSIARMIEHFDGRPRLGCAGFTVHLPGGGQDASALPGVFVGCGVGFRREALEQVGGLDLGFFMQAEEYDLSFRLAAAHWEVEVFDDLHVDHLKTATARRSERTTFLDVRNNLRVMMRYLPSPYHRAYRKETLLRYRWLSAMHGHQRAFARGVRAGTIRGFLERRTHAAWRMSPSVFERFFRLDEIGRHMHELSCRGTRSIVLMRFGKNVYPFVQGANNAGIRVLAIADDRFAAPRRRYHTVPIVPVAQALTLPCDAWVVGDTSPVHARTARQQARALSARPVWDWLGMPDEHPHEKPCLCPTA